MTLREEMAFENTPTEIWAILADPALMTLWNPKCVKCVLKAGPIRTGLRYKATFRLRDSEQESDCEVVECVPEKLLKTRCDGKAFKVGGYVDETFRIVLSETKTILIHEVDFTHSGLPWLILVMMRLIDKFGYSVEKSTLERIRELIGTDVRPPTERPSS